jgi:hypothetical protein
VDPLGLVVIAAPLFVFVAWWFVGRWHERRVAARAQRGDLTTAEIEGVAGPTDGSGQMRLAQSMQHTGPETAAYSILETIRISGR